VSRRLFIFLVALFSVCGALLLLSALIEAPETEDAAPVNPPAAHSVSAFVSMPPVPTSASVLPAGAWLRVAALFAAAIVLSPCLLCTCDANGRVLRRKRYVRSFHLVFKQEIACG
jgi:hypothetical protein